MLLHIHKINLILLLFLFSNTCLGLNSISLNHNPKNKNNFFIENKGQWNDDVLFLAHMVELNVWITKKGVIYDYYKIENGFSHDELNDQNPYRNFKNDLYKKTLSGHRVRITFLNANNHPEVVTKQNNNGYYNYFLGNNSQEWFTSVQLFDEIILKDINEGINIRYYFEDEFIRYDFILEPKANITEFEFEIDGDNGLQINEKGELLIKTCFGVVKHGKLYAYQIVEDIQHEVNCKFEQTLLGRIRIILDNYDKNQELIVDPLVYSTFLGGSNRNIGKAHAIDNAGNVYITGTTWSDDFPTTVGAYQTNIGGDRDVFVTKLSSDGERLLFSSFIGGSNGDNGNALIIDEHENIYITGRTGSSNFPTTTNSLQQNFGGVYYDAFITKLNSTGNELLYSSFWGGSDSDFGLSISMDSDGFIYLIGETNSENLLTTEQAYQKSFGGYYDAFITKINLTDNELVYSTFLGGNSWDSGNSIVLDIQGNAYLTGFTKSENFPTTANAVQKYFGGYSDAFVTILNSSGSEVIYSTFLGGNFKDYGHSITLDEQGSVYLAGYTLSDDFPSTNSAFQNSFGGGDFYDAFIVKLTSGGEELAFSTFLGGNDNDYSNSIMLDNQGNVVVTGYTKSVNFPVTNDAYQKNLVSIGQYDVFVSILNPIGSELVYSTFIGGHKSDYGRSIKLDNHGNIFVIGDTYSEDFPTTTSAFQNTFNGSFYNAFITKLSKTVSNIGYDYFIIPTYDLLEQNYPNPFNPSTKIKYQLKTYSSVTITLYSITGEKIALLVDEESSVGFHSIEIDATKLQLSSGIYIYQIIASGFNGKIFTDSKKMLLIK